MTTFVAGFLRKYGKSPQKSGVHANLGQANRIRVLEGEMILILLVILLVLALGIAPVYPYSRGWGYYPSGTLGTILLIILILYLLRVV